MDNSTTILIVDDSRVLRMMICSLINKQYPEWEIIEAENSEDALSKCKRQPELALIVLDYSLPGMDGITMAGHLRKKYHDTPVALLTANIQPRIQQQAKELGFQFIPKPITPEKIATILKLVE